MRNKAKVIITLTIAAVLLFACASRQSLQKPVVKKAPDPRAVNRFIDGTIHDLNQNPTAALLAYQEALLYDSTSASIYLAMAKDYLMLGNAESALISLKRSMDLDTELLEARELASGIYLRQGELDLAQKSLEDILALDSTRVETYYRLATLYFHQNRFDKAAVMYEKMLDLQPNPSPQILMGLGELYMDSGRFDDASDVYQRFIDLYPNEGLGYYGFGLTQEARGDTVYAMDYYRKALQAAPDLVHARGRLAGMHGERQEWDEALNLYMDSVARDSTDLASWLSLGEIHRDQGDTTAALGVFEEAKLRFPEDWRAYVEVGRIHLNTQDFEQAFIEFHQVVELGPDVVWGWLFTGISLVHLDSLAQAEPYLLKAVNLVPEEPLANYYLGSLMAQQGRHAEAIPCLETALDVRPGWVAVISVLAECFETLEEYTTADAYFEQALAVEPENALILNNYGYSLSVRGLNLDRALTMATRALEIDPENGAYLDTVGWIHYQIGEYEKALLYIQRAYAVRRESVEVAEHLGDVYIKLGMTEEAKQVWQNALALDENNTVILEKLNRLAGER